MFRIEPEVSQLSLLEDRINAGGNDAMSILGSVMAAPIHAVCGLVKKYLRNNNITLLHDGTTEEKVKDSDVDEFVSLVVPSHIPLFITLTDTLACVAAESKTNLMTSDALGVIMAQYYLPCFSTDANATSLLREGATVVQVLIDRWMEERKTLIDALQL